MEVSIYIKAQRPMFIFHLSSFRFTIFICQISLIQDLDVCFPVNMTQDVENCPIDIVLARFRTATSPLRRLPLVSPHPDELHTQLGREVVRAIHAQARKVLKAFKLVDNSDDQGDDYDIDISTRGTEDRPETVAPTIMIDFKSFSTDRKALQEATQQITAFARERSGEPFCVEMIDQRLVYNIAYGPVRDRPDLFQCWEKMRVLVYECLEAHESTKGSMTSISLFRYGTGEYYGNNPVTIFITVDFDSEEFGWPEVIGYIEKSLKKHQLPALYIHIEHNVGISSAPPSLLDPEDERASNRTGPGRIQGDYNKTVNLGEVIGPANFVMREDRTEGYAGHGNLGCYVEVKTEAGSWERYGLTNYHIMRGVFPGFDTSIVNNKQTALVTPPAESSLLIADEDGLAPRSHEDLAWVESPPRSMHDCTLRAAQRYLDSLNESLQRVQSNVMGFPEGTYTRVNGYKADLIQAVEKKKDFVSFYHQFMGDVFAASGLKKRTSENGRLDWALIKVAESRTGTNILPDRSAWGRAQGPASNTPLFSFGRQLEPHNDSISLENQAQCQEGFKYGTTTGPIGGKFHMFMTNVQFKDDQHVGDDPISNEYIYQMKRKNRDEPFAGSIAYDEMGCVLGLLCRGLSCVRDSNRACVSSHKGVFQRKDRRHPRRPNPICLEDCYMS